MTTETKTKHTPGPWRLQTGHNTIYTLSGGNAGHTNCIGKVVCHGDHPTTSDVTLEEAEANAHLIAAAPELLEALRDMHLYCAELINERRIEAHDLARIQKILRNSHLVMTKATGGEQ